MKTYDLPTVHPADENKRLMWASLEPSRIPFFEMLKKSGATQAKSTDVKLELLTQEDREAIFFAPFNHHMVLMVIPKDIEAFGKECIKQHRLQQEENPSFYAILAQDLKERREVRAALPWYKRMWSC